MASHPATTGSWSAEQEIPKGQRHDRLYADEQDLRRPVLNIDPDDEKSASDPQISVAQKMLSATSGSILTSLLVTPLDVVRVRLQSQPNLSNGSHISSSRPSTAMLSSFKNLPPEMGVTACCREVFWVQNTSRLCVSSPSAPVMATSVSHESASSIPITPECAAEQAQRTNFNSTLDGLRKIARNEGIFTLWRGLSPTLVMAIPANVIYFAGYDWLRTSHASPIGPAQARISDTYSPLVAGSVARVLAAIAVSPIEMLRTRMQAASSTTGIFKETLNGLSEMVGVKGYMSLWRGLSLTLWRDVPFSAFYWWGYEFGKDALARVRAGEPLGATSRRRTQPLLHQNHTTVLVDSFLSGAGSGAVAALVTTPFDVGKTRQQVIENGERYVHDSTGQLPPERRSMPRFLWHIFRSEGIAGLFKGWAARCLKVAPACAIMISSYEIGKKMAGNMNERKGSQSS